MARPVLALVVGIALLPSRVAFLANVGGSFSFCGRCRGWRRMPPPSINRTEETAR